MNNALILAVATALAAGGATAQNISQSQSGFSNSQSISIGNVDGSKPAKKAKKGKAADSETVSSTQTDKSGNTQSVNVDGGGNISQNQTGRSNQQSINIGSGVSGGKPNVTQTQSGDGKKQQQTLIIDGKKVEK
jgi:hypothetical protein